MQDKWKAFKERHEQAADKFWQEHQEKVREVNGRYAHEIAKSKKLEEEVKSLSAKLEDLKLLEESKRKKLEEEVKSLSAEGNYNPKLWIMSCPLEVRYSCA